MPADRAIIEYLRSDCQQIHAQPRERNASWMSARLLAMRRTTHGSGLGQCVGQQNGGHNH
jgi:hypothetical protein